MLKKLSSFFVRKPCFVIGFCLIIIAGCKTKYNQTGLSFCYWKTTFDLNTKEDSLMSDLGVNHLYIRFFDVDWNPFEHEALPVATVGNFWSLNQNISMTPSIFITNTVMEKCSKTQLDSLAIRIYKRTSGIIDYYKESFISNYVDKITDHPHTKKLNSDSITKIARNIIDRRINEVLIDCDWTLNTRDNYFYFLKQIKKQFSPYSLTATLRLWQYKQRKTAGVPEADRCLLMCYSMESPTNYDIENSISSVSTLSKYMTKETYPLKLDVALPVFNWAVMFRNGNFNGLINNVNPDDYKDDTVNYAPVTENRYRLKKDMVLGNKYFRYGDETRIEQVSPTELEKMIKLLKRHIQTDDHTRITFFSWDTTYVKQYGIKNLKNYSDLLHH